MEGQTVIDLYGCIKAVVPHHEVFVRSKNKMETKCEITLENLSREDVKITLWGDTAREFDLDAIYNLPPPVLAVFTSLRIALFQQQPTPSSTNHRCIIIDPDIGQREDYEEEFSKAGDKRKLLTTPSKRPLHQEAKDRPLTQKKRSIEASKRTLFISDPEKKIRREPEQGSATSSSLAKEEHNKENEQ
ncbi:putative replication protein A, OB [Rosa chinensis]|uniref:Putative replication protein A, OB n=1 Tax=Rosa chinensis TaxID=74649 RepID=A0A2P6PAL6_ROSCH|nr:putative replication protein A, OB [Rosa chinensis]